MWEIFGLNHLQENASRGTKKDKPSVARPLFVVAMCMSILSASVILWQLRIETLGGRGDSWGRGIVPGFILIFILAPLTLGFSLLGCILGFLGETSGKRWATWNALLFFAMLLIFYVIGSYFFA